MIFPDLSRTAPVRFVALCRERENRPLLAVAGFGFIFLLWKARWMHYPELVFRYPFVSFDSFQWMLDALLYRGHNVAAVYRNPGLPLVLAGLGAIGLSGWLPVITTAMQGLFFIYLALLLRRFFHALPAAGALALLFFNFNLQTAFDPILADQWAVTLQLAAVYHLILAEEDSWHLIPFGVALGSSFLFQYAIAALAPAFVIYLFQLRARVSEARRGFDSRLLVGALVAAALTLPMFVYKAVRFHDPFHSGVVQFPLLKLHVFGVVFYAFNYLAFFGIGAGLVALYGLIRTLRDSGPALLYHLCMLSYGIFWILGYVWLDPRFLLYFTPSVAFYVAAGLSGIGFDAFDYRKTSVGRESLVWLAFGYAVLCGLHPRTSPYSRNELPLTPRMTLVVGMRPITEWGGNVDISFDGLHLENVTNGIPAVEFIASYYRHHRRFVDPALDGEAREIEQLKMAIPAGARVAECGTLPDDYYSKMRRELALEIAPLRCSAGAEIAIVSAIDPMPPTDHLLFAGRLYRLVSRNSRH